jgi:hypothetical protein
VVRDHQWVALGDSNNSKHEEITDLHKIETILQEKEEAGHQI